MENLSDEKWARVDEFPLYEVSSFGNVRRWRGAESKLLRPTAMQDGRLSVMLYADGTRQWKKVHRLVARAFLPEPDEERSLVAHNDGNPANNHVDNLRWATQKENLSDRIRHRTTLDGERNGRVKLTALQVAEIRARYTPRHPTNSAKALAIEFGVTDVAIIKAFRAENWKSVK